MRSIHGNKYLQTTLVECGWGATRKKDGYFKRKYESLIARRGKKKALVAVGHKIIVAAYHIIKTKVVYQEPVLHKRNDIKRKNKQIRSYLAKLVELGIEIKNIQSIPIINEGKNKSRFFTEHP